MFATLCALIPADRDYPERSNRLDILARILEGTIYDVLPYEFHDERGANNDYIPLRLRRPSVRYPLARIIVDDSLALVFSDGHFPTFDSADHDARSALAAISRDAGLNQTMQEAALRGSVGSVAVLLRVLRGRVFFAVLQTKYLTPSWDPEAPDQLSAIVEKYKVSGSQLNAIGYDIAPTPEQYWFMRRWNAEAEIWYSPWPVGTTDEPEIDSTRTVRHGLGFVPLVWIRNLPGGDDIDGASTFRSAVETNIEIDYQLSQAGRGLKYSSDPTLLIREPAFAGNEIIRSGGNALVVSEKGDAKLLEIGGTAAAAVIDYVRTLREFALEGVHANRSSPERLSGVQSGRAMELMNQGLIWLADNLRVSYGRAMLQLARMIVLASQRYPLRIDGDELPPIDQKARITLSWPRWYAPAAQDRLSDAQTLQTLVSAGLLSRETAIKSIADIYPVDDIASELKRIDFKETT